MISASNIHAEVKQDFSLRKVAGLLRHYEPPPIAGFEPSGNWRQQYAMFLLDPGISRVHARIDIRDDIATIVDCGSTNGTYINDARIDRHNLNDGDEIVVGSTRMRVEIRD